MTCRSCGFENMKNAGVCARCGAKLVWEGVVRKRDFRPSLTRGGSPERRRDRLGFFLQQCTMRLVAAFPVFEVLLRMPSDNRVWTAASIVPGLGQLLQGRLVRGTALLALWVLALLVLVFGYREAVVVGRGPEPYFQLWRLALLAPAVMALTHSYAVLNAMRLRDFCRTRREARIFAFGAAGIVLLAYSLFALMYRTEIQAMVVRRIVVGAYD